MLRSLVFVSLAAAAMAGCSPSEGGSPTPTGSNTQGASETETPKQQSTRPKVVKLTSVEPCKTFTAAQQQQLKIESSTADKFDIVKTGNDAPTCSYSGEDAALFSYNVSLVTDKGIDYWTESGNLDVDSAEVSGFPAKQVKLSGTSEGDCAVAVDVADGQQLFVQFLPIGDGYSQEQMCDNAKKGAELSLSTIQTLS